MGNKSVFLSNIQNGSGINPSKLLNEYQRYNSQGMNLPTNFHVMPRFRICQAAPTPLQMDARNSAEFSARTALPHEWWTRVPELKTMPYHTDCYFYLSTGTNLISVNNFLLAYRFCLWWICQHTLKAPSVVYLVSSEFISRPTSLLVRNKPCVIFKVTLCPLYISSTDKKLMRLIQVQSLLVFLDFLNGSWNPLAIKHFPYSDHS